jgi:hypothetical protein
MYFCEKLFSMKKTILYALLFFAILLVSSCGIYQKPCEGVGKINISKADS